MLTFSFLKGVNPPAEKLGGGPGKNRSGSRGPTSAVGKCISVPQDHSLDTELIDHVIFIKVDLIVVVILDIV